MQKILSILLEDNFSSKVLPEVSEVKYTQLTGFSHFNNIPTKEQFRIRKVLPTSKALYSLIQQPISVSYFVTFTINRNFV